VFLQQVMGKELQTFLDYPPMQRGANFNLDAVKSRDGEKNGTGGGGEQTLQPVIQGIKAGRTVKNPDMQRRSHRLRPGNAGSRISVI
jgi:hypothetical protein